MHLYEAPDKALSYIVRHTHNGSFRGPVTVKWLGWAAPSGNSAPPLRLSVLTGLLLAAGAAIICTPLVTPNVNRFPFAHPRNDSLITGQARVSRLCTCYPYISHVREFSFGYSTCCLNYTPESKTDRPSRYRQELPVLPDLYIEISQQLILFWNRPRIDCIFMWICYGRGVWLVWSCNSKNVPKIRYFDLRHLWY